MSLETKVTLVDEMKEKLSDLLTANDLTTVLGLLTDELGNYDVTRLTDYEPEEDDLLSAYIDALTVQGRSVKTIERYRYTIGKLNAATKVPTRRITVHHLRRYLLDEKERGLSDRTLEGMRQVFSGYFNWLQREGLIDKNPTANLGAIHYAKKQKEILSEADIEVLKFECKNTRDRAIVCFLRATGCRISEVTGLNRDDVDLVNMKCRVLGKGNKERTVFLDQIAAMTLQKYLDGRTDLCPALFIGKGTSRLKPGGVRSMLNKVACKAGVNHVHPHKFRRTMATNLIKHGMAIQEVAAILGHDKLDTTMEYVVLDTEGIKHEYQKFA